MIHAFAPWTCGFAIEHVGRVRERLSRLNSLRNLPGMGFSFRHLCGPVSFVVAVVALVSQLALGAMVLPDNTLPDVAGAIDAVGILCAGSPTPDHGPGQRDGHTHRPAAPAICPIGAALALPSIVPAPLPVLPAPPAAILVSRTHERPPGTGPPPPTARVGIPRAPPLTA